MTANNDPDMVSDSLLGTEEASQRFPINLGVLVGIIVGIPYSLFYVITYFLVHTQEESSLFTLVALAFGIFVLVYGGLNLILVLGTYSKKIALLFVAPYVMSLVWLIQSYNPLSSIYLVLVTSSTLIMISVGLTLTIRVRKFSNFAQGELLVVGLYGIVLWSNLVDIVIDLLSLGESEGSVRGNVLFALSEWFIFQLLIAGILAGIVAVLCEWLVYGPLIKRKAPRVSLMVGSIGVALVLRQVVQELFTGKARSPKVIYPGFFDSEIITRFFDFPFPVKLSALSFFFVERRNYGQLIISRTQIWGIFVMIVMLTALWYIMTRTTFGYSMRATSDDRDLAEVSGVDTTKVIWKTWFVIGFISGVGAYYYTALSVFVPGTGQILLLIIFAVVILGGFGSVTGTIVAGIIIQASTSIIVTAFNALGRVDRINGIYDRIIFWNFAGDWSQFFPYMVLIVVLIFRPRGIAGLVDPREKL